ncbi:MAG: hypothetical protein ACRCXZ_10385 [Patescibacteria group bacterium]
MIVELKYNGSQTYYQVPDDTEYSLKSTPVGTALLSCAIYFDCNQDEINVVDGGYQEALALVPDESNWEKVTALSVIPANRL